MKIDMCATSEKICYVKLGFQILYAEEQFSSLFSKDKLKARDTPIPTHNLPPLRLLWENWHAVPSQQLPHVLCGAGAERSALHLPQQ